MKSESEKLYSNMVAGFDPDKPTKRKSIDDIKDVIYSLLVKGLTLGEISAIVNYNMFHISNYCVKTWGDDYKRKLKKKAKI